MVSALVYRFLATGLTSFNPKKIALQTDLCDLFHISDQHARRIGSGLELGPEEGDNAEGKGEGKHQPEGADEAEEEDNGKTKTRPLRRGKPFEAFETLSELLQDTKNNSPFAEKEGLTEPFVEYRRQAVAGEAKPDLKPLRKDVKTYRETLMLGYQVLPNKNTSRARALHQELDCMLNKWNQIVQLQKYADDKKHKEANQQIDALLPSEAEMKLIRDGDVMTTNVKKAAPKMAVFHDVVIKGAAQFNEEMRNDYISAYDTLSAPLENNKEWEDHYEKTTNQFEDSNATRVAYTGLLAVCLRMQYQVHDSQAKLSATPITRESVLCTGRMTFPLKQ